MTDPALPRVNGRVLLRRFAPGDFARFQAYRRDAVVGRYQGWSAMDDAAAAAFIADMAKVPLFQPGEWVQLAVADRTSNDLVGDVGLCVRDEQRDTAEVGFTIAPVAQGMGLGTEAVQGAFALLFDATGVDFIECITDARNAPSIRLLDRIGMRVKQSREAEFKGEMCTEHVYGMARSDWTRPLE